VLGKSKKASTPKISSICSAGSEQYQHVTDRGQYHIPHEHQSINQKEFIVHTEQK